MKKDAEESGSVIKKIMCFLTEVIVDVDGDFMTEAPRARLRLYKLQHDTPKVIRDGLKLLQDYQAGKPLDSNDVHSYLKMLDQWGPHVTGTMAGLAGVRGNLKGRQAFRSSAQAHKPGSAGGHEFKPQSRTVEALGLDSSIKKWQYDQYKNGLKYSEFIGAERVRSGTKNDIHHRATTLGLDPNKRIHSFHIRGKDDRAYTLFMQSTKVNGRNGVFEYIVDSKGQITHQRFKAGAKIDGKPN